MSIDQENSRAAMEAALPCLRQFAADVLEWKQASGDPTLNDVLPIAEAAMQEHGELRAAGLLRFAHEVLAWHKASGDPTIGHLLPMACEGVAIAEGRAAAERRGGTEARARAHDILARYPTDVTVQDLYDIDDKFASALRELAGQDFEYPDFAGLTIDRARAKAERLWQSTLSNQPYRTLEESRAREMVTRAVSETRGARVGAALSIDHPSLDVGFRFVMAGANGRVHQLLGSATDQVRLNIHWSGFVETCGRERAEAAAGAFWAEFAKGFPELTTGDARISGEDEGVLYRWLTSREGDYPSGEIYARLPGAVDQTRLDAVVAAGVRAAGQVLKETNGDLPEAPAYVRSMLTACASHVLEMNYPRAAHDDAAPGVSA